MFIDRRTTTEDLRTFWKNTVGLVNGAPKMILNIEKVDDSSAIITSKGVEGGRFTPIIREVVTNNTLRPPDGRLGMLNINGLTFFCSRKPVRRFQMGLTEANLECLIFPQFRYDRDVHRFATYSVEFFEMLSGKYPSLLEAIERVKTFGGLCAFDRQFAVDEERKLFFRDQEVGRLARGTIDKRGIQMKPGHEHLYSIIGGYNHEEACAAFRG